VLLFCFAGLLSFTYFRFASNTQKAVEAAPPAQLDVVEADALTGLTDVVPRLVDAPEPIRPVDAPSLQPTILVRALVGGDGTVAQTEIVAPRPEMMAFEAAALQAVKTYRFKPAQRAGKVVAAWINLPVSFSLTAKADVMLRGSLGFERFATALAQEFAASGAKGQLKHQMDGASACTGALFEGEADVCLTSRALNQDELELAKAVGVNIQEHVVGFAHAAVIVHPLSSVTELTLPQLASLYQANHKNWTELGGQDWPVKLLGTAHQSVAAEAFQNAVFAEWTGDFAELYEQVATTEELFAIVARTPGAIAFAGTQEVAAKVANTNLDIKVLAVAAAAGAATLPAPQTFAQRSYPLRSQVYAYALAQADATTYRLLETLLSRNGRSLALQHDLAPGPQINLPPFKSPGVVKKPQVFHVEFIAGSIRLDVAARLRLDQVALLLAEAETRWAVALGHADPVSEPSLQAQLSQKRAEAVERYLTSGGLGKGRVEVRSFGAQRPRSAKTDHQAQHHNRRVDVFVVERGG
jgi:TonB family protein